MKRVVVIGIGIFGFNLVKELYENGMEVILEPTISEGDSW